MAPLNPGISQRRKQEVRSGVRNHRPGIAVYVYFAEKQVDKRNSKKNEARNRKQKMRCRIKVTQPLRKRESGSKKRILDAQNLRHAACPANALADVGGKAFRGQARGLRDINVRSVPAALLH